MIENMDNMMKHSMSLQAISELNIDSIGYMRANRTTRLYRPRTLQSYAIVYVFEGNGEFASESGGYHKIGAGDCFVLYPGESHLYGPRGTDGYWREYWVICSGAMLQRLTMEGALSREEPVVRMSRQTSREVRHILQGMHEQYRMHHSLSRNGLYAGLFEVLLHLCRPEGDMSVSPDDHLEVSEMKALLKRHLYSDKRTEEFFTTDTESYHALRLRFKQLTGMSPRAFITSMRISLAKDLLIFSDLPIGEISLQSGYPDQFYFSRIFKQQVGLSPREYRHQYISSI